MSDTSMPMSTKNCSMPGGDSIVISFAISSVSFLKVCKTSCKGRFTSVTWHKKFRFFKAVAKAAAEHLAPHRLLVKNL